MGGEEINQIQNAFDLNWIAPVGPHIKNFESKLSKIHHNNEGVFKSLKNKSLEYGGNFSLLWHNSHFRSTHDKPLFEKVLSE